MEIIEIIIQSIGYIIPALVVYFLMRQFLRGHIATEQMKIRAAHSSDSKAVRMQAYERLLLLCERIKLDSLMLRLNNKEMDGTQLKNAILISIQKEYEHNLTQQIYVSGELWQMISLYKDNLIASVTSTFVNAGSDKPVFESSLLEVSGAIDASLGQKVREGIRKEVELYFT